MLSELCAEVRNYFCTEQDIHYGTFEIVGGSISPLDFLQEGQYFRIVGSIYNDGVYQYPTNGLTDEKFVGSVWAMRVPPAFIALSEDIKKYNESEAAKPSAYTSESFGGYSYTKATDSNGVSASWETVFSKRLKKYRRIQIL